MKRSLWLILIAVLLLIGLTVGVLSLSEDETKKQIEGLIRHVVAAKHPDWPAGSIKVSFKYSDSTFKLLTGREGKVEFAIADVHPDFDPVGDAMVPLQVFVDGKRAEIVYVRANVEVWLDIVVAAKKLKRTSLIKSGDIRLAKKDVSRMPERFFLKVDDIVGKEITSTISKNTVVQDWMVRIPPLVSKNDEVVIIAKLPALKATAVGVAMDDGYMGDKIKVRNKDTMREISGVVTSTDEVSVELR